MRDTETYEERISGDPPSPFNDELFIKRCRQLGINSQDAQAEHLGTTQPTISRIRRGRQVPPADKAVRFARALNLSVEELWPVAA